MFKKIHSNRDPRDTLYSELKKEFVVYVIKGNGIFQGILSKFPRFIFGFMIVLLLSSLIAAIALHRKMLLVINTTKSITTIAQTTQSGFDNIMAAGVALKQTIRLRRQVDSITAGKSLSKMDSVTLLRDLDSLQHIRLTLTPIKP